MATPENPRITHERVMAMLDRCSMIVTDPSRFAVERREHQTLAADFAEFLCDWLREHGIDPECPACQQGNCPP